MNLTCLCNTHGRPFLLEEAIECYLRQEIPRGYKTEMLIYNDCPEQKLSCDNKRVRIINLARPINNFSRKQNEAVAACLGEWVMLWDDDDIALPFKIRNALTFVRENPQYKAVKPSRAWYWDDGVIHGRGRSQFWGAATYHRETYLHYGGAILNDFADKSAWSKVAAQGRGVSIFQKAEDTDFLYRWSGTGSVHDSQGTIHLTPEQRHTRFRNQVLRDPRFVEGEIKLNPHWDVDYLKMVRDAINAGKGNTLL